MRISVSGIMSPTASQLLLILFLGGCTDNDEVEPYSKEIAVMTTNNNKYGVVAAHKNGEKLIIGTVTDTSGNLSRVGSAIWISPKGKSFWVQFDNNTGLPKHAVYGDYIFLFSNYSKDTVDVGLILPSGKHAIKRKVKIKSDDISQIGDTLSVQNERYVLPSGLSINTKTKALSFGKWSLVKVLKVACLSLAVAGCAGAFITTHVVAAATLAIPCGTAVASLARNIIPKDNAALEATSIAMGAIGCGGGDPFSCAGLILDTAESAVSKAQKTYKAKEKVIKNVENELKKNTCVSICSGKECGNDGCGGSCPPGCTTGKTCQSGKCVGGTCSPKCTGKECGDNGCGGSCGTCPSGKYCNKSTNKCVLEVCVELADGKWKRVTYADKSCNSWKDCWPACCCHPFEYVNKNSSPDCVGMLCTSKCVPGTTDCGQGKVKCVNNICTVEFK